MQSAKALFKISRPISTLSGVLAVVLGGYVAGTGAWDKIILASLATLLVSAGANAWNDYLDIEIDKINQPKRPLPSGQLSPQVAVVFSVLMSFLSLLLTAFINLPAFLVAVATNLLLYLYSWRMKSTVLMGNAIVAFISAASIIFGGIAAGNVGPTLLLAVIIAFAIMGREVLKTMADYEGDLTQHCQTVATVWGRRWARVIFYLLIGMTLILMMAPYVFDVYNPIYAYMVAFGVYPVILYVVLKVNRERTGPQLEKLSQLMKYDFLIWFLAVMLGSA